jgi:hypothetical protein
MKLIWLLPVMALALSGADITGKWTGNIEVDDPSSGNKINTPVRAQFDQKANAISGTIGRREDEQQETIRNARLEGKSLVFEVQSAETTGLVKFNLVVVSQDRIEGEMKAAIDVGNISGKVTLEKVR